MQLTRPKGIDRWRPALYLGVLLATLLLGIIRLRPASPPTPSPTIGASPGATVLASPSGSPSMGQTPAPTTIATGTAAPAAGDTATAAAAGPTAPPSPPTLGGALGERVGEVNDAALGAFLALLTLLVLIPGGAVLVVMTLLRLNRVVRRPQLVIEDLSDATGDDPTKTGIPAISQELRRETQERAARLYDDVQRWRAAHAANQLVSAPPPRKSADTALLEMVKAIGDSAPDQAKLVLALFALAFPARGRRVTSVLGLSGPVPRRLRISADVSDLAEPDNAVLAALREAPVSRPSSPSAPPSGGSPEATALTAVALAYERAGSWDSAQKKYEAALEKEPAYAGARDGLARMLEVASLAARAEALVAPAARWLALLLFESEWLRHKEHGVGGTLEEEKARVHNFVGIGLANLARHPLVDPILAYQAAIAEFVLARTDLPHWYGPNKNEADATSYLGVVLEDGPLQRRAIALYDLAIEKAEGEGYLSDQDPGAVRSDALKKLRIDRAIALVLLGETGQAQQQLDGAVGPNWNPAVERNPAVLYGIACFYARSFERGGTDVALTRLVQTLAYAFAVDPDLADDAVEDPDLTAVRPVVELLAGAREWTAVDASELVEDDIRELIDRAVSAMASR